MNEAGVHTGHMKEISSLDWTSWTTFARTLHELIARRAYEKWLARGCPSGTTLEDWLEAEAEVDTELGVRGKAGLIGSLVAAQHDGAVVLNKDW
jgi:hypothetical protein